MLIKPRELVCYWKVSPKSVLHIGAHLAEEFSSYENLGWKKVFWVEAQKELAQKLKSKLEGTSHEVIQAAIWDIDDLELKLKVTNNSQSTSLLELGTHKSDYPEISVSRVETVRTSRVDSLFSMKTIPDFINLDIQGAEIQALRGFGKLLQNVKYIYCEVNKKEVYVGCAVIDEIDGYLSEFGFSRVITKWVPFKGWGDAYYCNTNMVKNSTFQQALGKFFGWIYPVEYYTTSCLSRLRKFLKK